MKPRYDERRRSECREGGVGRGVIFMDATALTWKETPALFPALLSLAPHQMSAKQHTLQTQMKHTHAYTHIVDEWKMSKEILTTQKGLGWFTPKAL